jgi:hypothetical protein
VNKSYFEIYLKSIPTEAADSNEAVPFDNSGISNTPTGQLAGKVAVVTGASSGIGRAIVAALVKEGCHVAMGTRLMDQLEETKRLVAAECPGTSSKALVVKTDVTKLSDVQTLVQKAEDSLGPVDILVNVAGVMYFTLMENVNIDQWTVLSTLIAKEQCMGLAQSSLPCSLLGVKVILLTLPLTLEGKHFRGWAFIQDPSSLSKQSVKLCVLKQPHLDFGSLVFSLVTSRHLYLPRPLIKLH